MKIETQLNKRREAVQKIHNLYSHARHFGLSHAEMLERFDKVMEGLAKCPSSIQAYVQGYRDALMDRDREDYYVKLGFTPNVYADDGLVKDRGHYWKENLKPFFISK